MSGQEQADRDLLVDLLERTPIIVLSGSVLFTGSHAVTEAVNLESWLETGINVVAALAGVIGGAKLADRIYSHEDNTGQQG